MISREDFDAYGRAVSAITDSASQECERQVLAWCRAHPDATVAETREAAREIMAGLAQVYDEASASLAAEWYDAQASAAGARLPEAITVTTYSDAQVERVAHYQAGKLAAGDVAGFAAACAEFLENGVRRSLNETIIANARRDRESGVLFARVPTGSETCSFCYMLASRGAVYESRKTAGEQRHFHRHCDCKIVPGFKSDRFAEVVEGYRPLEMIDRMRQIERETGLKFGDDSSQMSRLTEYMRLHGKRWLHFGEIPEVDYSENPMSAYGRLLVEGDWSPENIVDRGNEWRDLWAHHVLSENGFSVTPHGREDIDLTLDGVWWEVKSPGPPEVAPRKGRELSFIENDVRKAVRQFRKRGMADSTRIIFNPRYRHDASDKELKEELKRQMSAHGVKEAIFINEDGSVTLLT